MKECSGNGRIICFELYGGLKLPQIGPDNLFFHIWPLQDHPESSSDGFRGVSCLEISNLSMKVKVEIPVSGAAIQIQQQALKFD